MPKGLNKGLKKAWCVIHKMEQGASKITAQSKCHVGVRVRKTRRRR